MNDPKFNSKEDEQVQNRFTAYLVKSIRNTKLDYIVRKNREQRTFTSLDEMLENGIDPAALTTADYDVLFHDAKTLEEIICNDKLLIGVLKLSDRERQIMNLYLVQKMKHQEIADLLGLRRKTVEKCYERAIKKLRSHMEE